MQPNAILTAAAELLTQIIDSPTPANELINQYTRARRYIGSKDRRHLTDLVWHYLRHRARLEYLFPDADIQTRLNASQNPLTLPPDTPDWVQLETPQWLIPLIPNATVELTALLEPAPIVLRANGDRAKIAQLLAAEGLETHPTPRSPLGLILTKRANLNASKTYQSGLVEVQDEASQLVGLETQIPPDTTVLDYCAGAGGKSLLFAQMMQNRGKIVAHDISARSLAELEKRANRAHVSIIETTLKLNPSDQFDTVVVDAPCSGTGTWRRCPDARWKLTPEQLTTLTQKQTEILNRAATFVQSGGKLAYMTCSLTTPENTDQVNRFIETHPAFTCIQQKQFSPAQTQTDGLFVAVFVKKA